MELTYFTSLLIFVVPPILILGWIAIRRGALTRLALGAIAIHVLLSVTYTTPWDNYLVASGVWWYNPEQISGLLLGYVPIEEYIFFALQTIMTGLWVVLIMQKTASKAAEFTSDQSVRWLAATASGLTGIICLGLLFTGTQEIRYGALILSWASLPITLQFAFGADILLSRWRELLTAIIPPTIYLWLMDATSIHQGIWTIDPIQTTGFRVSTLPVEEMLFFFITNVMVVFGITLILAPESAHRINSYIQRIIGEKK